MAIASLIIGIALIVIGLTLGWTSSSIFIESLQIGVIIGIVGLVLGILALIKKVGSRIAIAAIVLNSLVILLSVVIFIQLMAAF